MLTIAFASWKDALFVGILVANIVIGSFQEIRSKRALDRLAALVAPKATVRRDGAERDVAVEEVVVGDLVRVGLGEQVVADGEIVASDGVAIDEANLTGESEPVLRGIGEEVWSGSFVVEGSALFEAQAVGPDSRAAKVTHTARAFRHPRSPLQVANDRLLLWLVGLAVPITIGYAISVLLRVDGDEARVQALTAGIVNLVPEGLILLIGLTAAVSAFKMARRGVLAQELGAIESLASVDLICTDKTGTLTEADLRLVELVPASGTSEDDLATALARYSASAPDPNSTLRAIAATGPAKADPEPVGAQVPFSSRWRWSAIELGTERFVLGAPELFVAADPELAERARAEASQGRRVLAIGRTEAPLPAFGRPGSDPPSKGGPLAEPALPTPVEPLGVAVLAERLRPGTEETIAFLAAEQVELRLLSGDAPATAGAIARDAGIPGDAPPLDGGQLPTEPAALREAVMAAPAVGRISPEGKSAVVEALTEGGRYVGMIGDGVNDVPALKRSRLAIAQGTGVQMARSVADLVLVKGDFGVVPGMVHEGRQILRNIQRVARLFVTKTVFTALMVLAIGIPTATFPLLPRQFTIASTVTIGIPAFILALAPSSGPWRPEHFIRNVARFALPAGIASGIGIVAGYLLARYGMDLDLQDSRTVATGTVVVAGLAVVMRLEDEPGRRRLLVAALCAVMALIFALALFIPFLRDFYELSSLTGDILLAWAAGSALAVGGMLAAVRLARV